jgi:hypothetical protein
MASFSALNCVIFVNHFEPLCSWYLRYKKNNTPYLSQQPPFFDNSCITKLSTTSSPKSGLANPSIDLALDYERPVLLDVDNVHLDA